MPVRSFDGGEAIVEAFNDLGVEYIISSPGSEWPPLWEALARRFVEKKESPRYVNCWHETIAVSMAMGYSLITLRGQGVVLHAGVGLLQGSIALRAAYRDRIPMVVCVGESSSLGEDRVHDMGSHWLKELADVVPPGNLVQGVAKWYVEVKDPSLLYNLIRRAGDISSMAPSGPSVLSIPMEVMRASWSPPPRHTRPSPSSPRPPSAEVIRQIASRLVESESPLIVTESIGRTNDGYNALLKFAESFSVPVVESSSARWTNFPLDNPLHLGFGAGPFLQQTDLFLVVADRAPWYPTNAVPAADAIVVAIDEVPYHDYMPLQPTYPDILLEADPVMAINALTRSMEGNHGPSKERMAEWKAASAAEHRRQKELIDRERRDAKEKKPIDPIHLCETLERVMPADTAYVEETTIHDSIIKRHLRRSAPLTYYRPAGGGLGLGLGLSLGVKLAVGEKKIVACLIGDGALLYNPSVQAFGAAKEHGLPFMTVVFNNHSYGSMKRAHQKQYPRGFAGDHAISYGVNISGLEYSQLARLFGGYGERVEDPEHLEGAVARVLGAVREGKLGLLDVVLSS